MAKATSIMKEKPKATAIWVGKEKFLKLSDGRVYKQEDGKRVRVGKVSKEEPDVIEFADAKRRSFTEVKPTSIKGKREAREEERAETNAVNRKKFKPIWVGKEKTGYYTWNDVVYNITGNNELQKVGKIKEMKDGKKVVSFADGTEKTSQAFTRIDPESKKGKKEPKVEKPKKINSRRGVIKGIKNNLKEAQNRELGTSSVAEILANGGIKNEFYNNIAPKVLINNSRIANLLRKKIINEKTYKKMEKNIAKTMFESYAESAIGAAEYIAGLDLSKPFANTPYPYGGDYIQGPQINQKETEAAFELTTLSQEEMLEAVNDAIGALYTEKGKPKWEEYRHVGQTLIRVEIEKVKIAGTIKRYQASLENGGLTRKEAAATRLELEKAETTFSELNLLKETAIRQQHLKRKYDCVNFTLTSFKVKKLKENVEYLRGFEERAKAKLARQEENINKGVAKNEKVTTAKLKSEIIFEQLKNFPVGGKSASTEINALNKFIKSIQGKKGLSYEKVITKLESMYKDVTAQPGGKHGIGKIIQEIKKNVAEEITTEKIEERETAYRKEQKPAFDIEKARTAKAVKVERARARDRANYLRSFFVMQECNALFSQFSDIQKQLTFFSESMEVLKDGVLANGQDFKDFEKNTLETQQQMITRRKQIQGDMQAHFESLLYPEANVDKNELAYYKVGNDFAALKFIETVLGNDNLSSEERVELISSFSITYSRQTGRNLAATKDGVYEASYTYKKGIFKKKEVVRDLGAVLDGAGLKKDDPVREQIESAINDSVKMVATLDSELTPEERARADKLSQELDAKQYSIKKVKGVLKDLNKLQMRVDNKEQLSVEEATRYDALQYLTLTDKLEKGYSALEKYDMLREEGVEADFEMERARESVAECEKRLAAITEYYAHPSKQGEKVRFIAECVDTRFELAGQVATVRDEDLALLQAREREKLEILQGLREAPVVETVSEMGDNLDEREVDEITAEQASQPEAELSGNAAYEMSGGSRSFSAGFNLTAEDYKNALALWQQHLQIEDEAIAEAAAEIAQEVETPVVKPSATIEKVVAEKRNAAFTTARRAQKKAEYENHVDEMEELLTGQTEESLETELQAGGKSYVALLAEQMFMSPVTDSVERRSSIGREINELQLKLKNIRRKMKGKVLTKTENDSLDKAVSEHVEASLPAAIEAEYERRKSVLQLELQGIVGTTPEAIEQREMISARIARLDTIKSEFYKEKQAREIEKAESQETTSAASDSVEQEKEPLAMSLEDYRKELAMLDHEEYRVNDDAWELGPQETQRRLDEIAAKRAKIVASAPSIVILEDKKEIQPATENEDRLAEIERRLKDSLAMRDNYPDDMSEQPELQESYNELVKEIEELEQEKLSLVSSSETVNASENLQEELSLSRDDYEQQMMLIEAEERELLAKKEIDSLEAGGSEMAIARAYRPLEEAIITRKKELVGYALAEVAKRKEEYFQKDISFDFSLEERALNEDLIKLNNNIDLGFIEKYGEKYAVRAMEEGLQEKFGFNRDYIAEGFSHASPENVLNGVKRRIEEAKKKGASLTAEEQQFLVGAYGLIGNGKAEIYFDNAGGLQYKIKDKHGSVILQTETKDAVVESEQETVAEEKPEIERAREIYKAMKEKEANGLDGDDAYFELLTEFNSFPDNIRGELSEDISLEKPAEPIIEDELTRVEMELVEIDWKEKELQARWNALPTEGLSDKQREEEASIQAEWHIIDSRKAVLEQARAQEIYRQLIEMAEQNPTSLAAVPADIRRRQEKLQVKWNALPREVRNEIVTASVEKDWGKEVLSEEIVAEAEAPEKEMNPREMYDRRHEIVQGISQGLFGDPLPKEIAEELAALNTKWKELPKEVTGKIEAEIALNSLNDLDLSEADQEIIDGIDEMKEGLEIEIEGDNIFAEQDPEKVKEVINEALEKGSILKDKGVVVKKVSHPGLMMANWGRRAISTSKIARAEKHNYTAEELTFVALHGSSERALSKMEKQQTEEKDPEVEYMRKAAAYLGGTYPSAALSEEDAEFYMQTIQSACARNFDPRELEELKKKRPKTYARLKLIINIIAPQAEKADKIKEAFEKLQKEDANFEKMLKNCGGNPEQLIQNYVEQNPESSLAKLMEDASKDFEESAKQHEELMQREAEAKKQKEQEAQEAAAEAGELTEEQKRELSERARESVIAGADAFVAEQNGREPKKTESGMGGRGLPPS